MWISQSFLIYLILFIGVGCTSVKGEIKQNNDVILRQEILDEKFEYVVSWKVNFTESMVEFAIKARTNGFIGFGISPTGGMTGADIVIGGFGTDGKPYFADYHGTGTVTPSKDESQDWVLIDANETDSHTTIRFRRLIDTCDKDDLPFTYDSSKFIWSVGTTDDLNYHDTNRGVQAVFILDPPQPPVDFSQFSNFTLEWNYTMPKQHTTYWCSVFKSPKFTKMQHIVGFKPVFRSSDGLLHTHHFVIYKCQAPAGQDTVEYFEKFVGEDGGECFLPKHEQKVPYEDCTIFTYDWSVGGRTFVFPHHIGLPVGELGIPDYYMFEIHMDNPNELQDVQVESGVEIYYTPNLRKNDAGLLRVSYDIVPSHTLPPNTPKFVTAGHCSAKCTSYLPDDGINLFAVNIHAHISGRELKIRHFRDGKELPWVISNEMYDFNYQDNRPLLDELKILPKDHLTLECTYDTTWKKPPSVVIGGWSTREEMCESYLYYYPRQPILDCKSGYPNEKIYSRFGIERVSEEFGEFDPRVLAPEKYYNWTYSEVLNAETWTDALKNELQQELMFAEHYDACVIQNLTNLTDGWPTIKYPDYDKAYEAINLCNARDDGSPRIPTDRILFFGLIAALMHYIL